MENAPSVPLDKVEWRVDGQPHNGRSRFVPYIDGRDAAALLDGWVGPENWKDEYEAFAGADGNSAMWCILSIRVDDEWVSKRDVGVAPNFEKTKGLVSDAFKRVATIKWGVGRNVYDLPTVWAPCDVYKDRNNKDQAKANDKTKPAIIADLKRQGFDVTGVRIQSSETEAGGVASTGSPSPVSGTAEASSSPADGTQSSSSPASSSAAQDQVRQGGGSTSSPSLSNPTPIERINAHRKTPGNPSGYTDKEILDISKTVAAQWGEKVTSKADVRNLRADVLEDIAQTLESRVVPA